MTVRLSDDAVVGDNDPSDPSPTDPVSIQTDACMPGDNPAAGGRFRPENPLSVFNGMDSDGTWTFTVDSLDVGSGGAFNQFCLHLSGE